MARFTRQLQAHLGLLGHPEQGCRIPQNSSQSPAEVSARSAAGERDAKGLDWKAHQAAYTILSTNLLAEVASRSDKAAPWQFHWLCTFSW